MTTTPKTVIHLLFTMIDIEQAYDCVADGLGKSQKFKRKLRLKKIHDYRKMRLINWLFENLQSTNHYFLFMIRFGP